MPDRPTLIGTTLPRREDDRLLRGTRRSVGDRSLPGLLELALVRSEVAHGDLVVVDTAAARAVPGVVGAWSAAELPELPDVPPPAEEYEAYPWPGLARDRVRYVGQPVAAVLAATRYLAEDGCDAVRVEVSPRPALVDPREGLSGRRLFDDADDLVADRHIGDGVDEIEAALASAPVVVEATWRQQLIAPTSLEGRSILARPDDDGGLTVWAGHQAPHRLRSDLAQALELEERLVRVVVPDVGGAFGHKSQTWPEYVVVAALARRTGRPVRWLEDRREALVGGPHGRGQWQTVRLAATEEGDLLALDLDIVADVGAFPHTGDMVPRMTALTACGQYRLTRAHVRVRTVVTTTAPTSSYRGAGRPEAAYALERTMDVLALRLGMDPVALRRRNLLPADAFPWSSPTGAEYDSGAYEAALDLALRTVDVDGVRAEQARRRASGEGPLLGLGLCCYVERSGATPGSPEYAALEALPGGTYVAWSGSSSTGQSHETVFPQVVAAALDVAPGTVRLVQGDTREVPQGFGSFGSRSLQVGGGALWLAAETLARRARERLADALGVPLQDVSYAGGEVTAGATRWSLGEVAARTGPLRVEEVFRPPQAFPFGCYAAVVEVDPALGAVSVRKVVAVDDYGVVVSPGTVDGQGLGSTVQGLGQALYEDARYAPDGSLPGQSLLDHLLPTVAEVPEIVLEETETPNPHSPFGAKGAGEAGCIGTPPAVLNAIADALQLDDPTRLQLPATPDRVWALLQERRVSPRPAAG